MAISIPLSTNTTGRSPQLGGQPTTIRNAADAQAALSNRLAERLGLPPGSLTAKQDDFSPEKVADRVMGFVEQRLKSEAASGASPEKLQQLLDQARSGVQKGFDEARKILDGMGVLKDKIASDIDDTFKRIQQGFAGLDKLYGSAPSTGGNSGVTPTSSDRFAAVAESFELNITTRDGDRLRVSVAQASAAWSRSEGTNSQSGSLQIGGWQVEVEGELDDEEKAALGKLFSQVQDLSNSFYSGDMAGAFDRAMALDMDSSQLASMSLRLTQTSVRQATDTYGSVSNQGGQPASATNGALTDYAQGLLDALRTADAWVSDGKGLLQDLLKGGFSLDERFDSGRLEKAEQVNGRLLDGLQGLLSSTLTPQAGEGNEKA
ncbi:MULTISPECIES: DUF5610 domain-containing protein [Pseudomonas]|uniref:DUF5610 domain-containing protein n=1 Tax=Pseudomonas fulva (strain 12-X) TaxID=743720 RepID=F6AKC3_PSEF1|nr:MULTISPECIES: DUF5610 domain-containing protein [Pseudomonas]AEF21837.1 hypothetical protein Psefu_1864 [Pseudomonas fulva 12-X]PZW71002.1 hypothetical protein F471_00070 [Pseudomonas sp. URMO17WK12:I1]